LDSAIKASSKDVLLEKMTAAEGTGIDITAGFPEKIEGEILFLDADNINTNGIYPGNLDSSFCFISKTLTIK
jgi:homoaconitate hydratase